MESSRAELKPVRKRLRESWTHHDSSRCMDGFANRGSFMCAIFKGDMGTCCIWVALEVEYYLEPQNKDKKHH